MFLAEGKLIRWFCVMTAVRLTDVATGCIMMVTTVVGDAATPIAAFATLRAVRLAGSVTGRSAATMYGVFVVGLGGLVTDGARPWFALNFFTHMGALTVMVVTMWVQDALYFGRRWGLLAAGTAAASSAAAAAGAAAVVPVEGSGASKSMSLDHGGDVSGSGGSTGGGDGGSGGGSDLETGGEGSVVRRKVPREATGRD